MTKASLRMSPPCLRIPSWLRSQGGRVSWAIMVTSLHRWWNRDTVIQSHIAGIGGAGIWTQIAVDLMCGANWYTWSFSRLETVVSSMTPQYTAGYTQHLEKRLSCVPVDWWLLSSHRNSFGELAKSTEEWTRQERLMPVILELGRWRQEEQELKVISYLWSLRQTWATGKPDSQKKKPIKWKGLSRNVKKTKW